MTHAIRRAGVAVMLAAVLALAMLGGVALANHATFADLDGNAHADAIHEATDETVDDNQADAWMLGYDPVNTPALHEQYCDTEEPCFDPSRDISRAEMVGLVTRWERAHEAAYTADEDTHANCADDQTEITVDLSDTNATVDGEPAGEVLVCMPTPDPEPAS